MDSLLKQGGATHMTAYSSAARKKGRFAAYMKQNFWLYIFLIPGMVFLLLMNYLPMFGIIIAFKNFRVVKGVFGSDWVGLKHFQYLFHAPDFYRILRNSLTLSLLRLVCGFPMPIILALMMNEMGNQGYKRTMQTILYLPHFISWVVVISILYNILSTSTGMVNDIIAKAGGEKIAFLTTSRYFRPIIVLTDIWKGAGWGTIVYMAAISGIDSALYEAAIIDGASRLQRIWYVTLPTIAGTIVVMLIMRTGSILNNGFEEVYLLKNALTSDVADIFETYTYEIGLQSGQFSYASAVGLFQSVVGCVLIFITNTVSRKIGGGGLW